MKTSNTKSSMQVPGAARDRTSTTGQPQQASLLEPTLVGIWLDRRRASLVVLRGTEQTTATLDSGVEERVRGGKPPPEPGKYNRLRNLRRQQLARFYQQLIERLKDADSIYLLGPGETKQELANAIRARRELKGRLLAVESARSMSPRQLVDHVRRAFDEQPTPGPASGDR